MQREVYRECMRNHAATLGTYTTDGCGEYTPDPMSPATPRCAACGCHRNFHRKIELYGAADSGSGGYSLSGEEQGALEMKRRPRTKFTAEQKEQMLQFAEKIGWRIPRREGAPLPVGMDEVGRFCAEIGVSRQVFKVWMHNHKNTSSPSAGTSSNVSSPLADASSPDCF